MGRKRKREVSLSSDSTSDTSSEEVKSGKIKHKKCSKKSKHKKKSKKHKKDKRKNKEKKEIDQTSL